MSGGQPPSPPPAPAPAPRTFVAKCGAKYRVESDQGITVLLLCGGKSPYVPEERLKDDDYRVCPECAELEQRLMVMTAKVGKEGPQ